MESRRTSSLRLAGLRAGFFAGTGVAVAAVFFVEAVFFEPAEATGRLAMATSLSLSWRHCWKASIARFDKESNQRTASRRGTGRVRRAQRIYHRWRRCAQRTLPVRT